MATTTANGTGTLKDAIGDLREAGSLGQALEALQANVFIADPSLNIVFANDCAKRTLRKLEDQLRAAFGVGVDEVIGGSIHRFHKDPKAVEAILKRPELLPHQAQFTFGTVTLKATINAVSGHAGTVEGYIVNWEDVSDRLRVENEMARVQSMMENSPTNMMFADRDLTIRYMNPASLKTLRTLEEHLPVPADKVVGSSLDIFHKNPKYQRSILADDKQLPRRANIQVGPETLDLLVSPIRDADGNHIGAMATWEIITEKLRLEAETKNAAERERQQAEELRTKVEQILAAVNGAASGDLTVNVGVSGEDAIGRVGSSLSAFLSDLRSSVGAIGQNAETLASASEELTATAVQMSSSADHTSSQASIVSSTSEEVSSSIQTVAVGAEQLTASIREIAKNTTDAARVATSAVQVAESTNATVAKLGESSAEIGKVIKVITSIAQQTNLLALNATIEAARAGAAGKGFAVVANEVKELAKETAKATEDIGAKIDAIQSDTLGAVAAIAEISSIITQINDFQSLIAAAVEEQTATTNEIATNVHEAAGGSGDIARNIVGVADAAKSTSTGAGDTQRAASDLARMAAELQQLVARFSY